jgi:hypothetical protein
LNNFVFSEMDLIGLYLGHAAGKFFSVFRWIQVPKNMMILLSFRPGCKISSDLMLF